MPHVGTQARAGAHVTVRQSRRLRNDNRTDLLLATDFVRQ